MELTLYSPALDTTFQKRNGYDVVLHNVETLNQVTIIQYTCLFPSFMSMPADAVLLYEASAADQKWTADSKEKALAGLQQKLFIYAPHALDLTGETKINRDQYHWLTRTPREIVNLIWRELGLVRRYKVTINELLSLLSNRDDGTHDIHQLKSLITPRI